MQSAYRDLCYPPVVLFYTCLPSVHGGNTLHLTSLIPPRFCIKFQFIISAGTPCPIEFFLFTYALLYGKSYDISSFRSVKYRTEGSSSSCVLSFRIILTSCPLIPFFLPFKNVPDDLRRPWVLISKSIKDSRRSSKIMTTKIILSRITYEIQTCLKSRTLLETSTSAQVVFHRGHFEHTVILPKWTARIRRCAYLFTGIFVRNDTMCSWQERQNQSLRVHMYLMRTSAGWRFFDVAYGSYLRHVSLGLLFGL